VIPGDETGQEPPTISNSISHCCFLWMSQWVRNLIPWVTALIGNNGRNSLDTRVIGTKKNNVSISSTPSIELQTSMSHTIAFSAPPELQHLCSLGIDCHSMTSSSTFRDAHFATRFTRTVQPAFLDAGKAPTKINKTVKEAFDIGTITGAPAIRMEDQLGTLAVGKRADIVTFDALSRGRCVAAQYYPVTAIVLHARQGM
jgi:cytosine/adenosine deaminase-related metal-dependent hydrolase